MELNSLNDRLKNLGANSLDDIFAQLEAAQNENALLKKAQQQPMHFKSEAQKAFEGSLEFDQTLNIFFLRMLREKFSAEFQESPYKQQFLEVANKAFQDFEKNFNQKDGANIAQENQNPNGIPNGAPRYGHNKDRKKQLQN